jgi:hypothetical protein
LFGRGSWSGGYGADISVNNLPEPHKEEELFSYEN